MNNEDKKNEENNALYVDNKDNKDDKSVLVKQFRDNFNLSEEDFPNEKILKTLEKYNNNFNIAFKSFFG